MTSAQTFLRDRRAAASIEIALGAVVLVALSALAFDLYSRLEADTASARIAVTMAEYVSHETAPDGDQLTALGGFLHRSELRAPAHLVYVITAVQRPPGDRLAEVLWIDDAIRFGDAGTTQDLADACAQHGNAGWQTTLLGEPSRTGMSAGETVVVVEICARLPRQGGLTSRLVAGDIYRLHVLPVRNTDQAPSRPTYAPPADATAARDAATARRTTG